MNFQPMWVPRGQPKVLSLAWRSGILPRSLGEEVYLPLAHSKKECTCSLARSLVLLAKKIYLLSYSEKRCTRSLAQRRSVLARALNPLSCSEKKIYLLAHSIACLARKRKVYSRICLIACLAWKKTVYSLVRSISRNKRYSEISEFPVHIAAQGSTKDAPKSVNI